MINVGFGLYVGALGPCRHAAAFLTIVGMSLTRLTFPIPFINQGKLGSDHVFRFFRYQHGEET